MAKVTGYKCDVCTTVENGGDAPFHWHKLYLPRSSQEALQEAKDICSDKCLLTFSRERSGQSPTKKSRSTFDPDLAEFLTRNGVKRATFGPLTRGHISHSGKGIIQDDCLICEFMSQPVANGNV